MLKTIAIVIAVLVAAVLVYAAMQPDTFYVERSIVIKAPPEKIFPNINGFHQWEAWSPWEKIDPAIKRPTAVQRAAKARLWMARQQGRRDGAHGDRRIDTVLERVDQDRLHGAFRRTRFRFTLAPQGNGTKVTQAMYGPNPFLAKLVDLFFSMDKMVGQKYEEGLASLKAIAER